MQRIHTDEIALSSSWALWRQLALTSSTSMWATEWYQALRWAAANAFIAREVSSAVVTTPISPRQRRRCMDNTQLVSMVRCSHVYSKLGTCVCHLLSGDPRYVAQTLHNRHLYWRPSIYRSGASMAGYTTLTGGHPGGQAQFAHVLYGKEHTAYSTVIMSYLWWCCVVLFIAVMPVTHGIFLKKLLCLCS